MADERATGLRRTHSVALCLAKLYWDGVVVVPPVVYSLGERMRTFRLGLPDARLTVALSVAWDEGPAARSTWPWITWTRAGHVLCVQARERANQQSNKLLVVDNVYGSPTHPVPMKEDCVGFLVSGEPDAREWLCTLTMATPAEIVVADEAETIAATGVYGRWVVCATFTSHAEMTDAEWNRVANRVYLIGDEQAFLLRGTAAVPT